MHLFLLVNFCFVLMQPFHAFASGTEYYQEPVRSFQFNHDHGKWENLLRNILVNDGLGRKSVDVSILKRNRRQLDAYIESVESVAATEFREFSQNEQTAFLINAYNALTLRESLVDERAGLRTLASNSQIAIFSETYTADEFMRKFIRRRISDPRAFLALFCFDPGCPEMFPQALVPDKISAQIEQITTTFMLDKSRNTFDKESKVLRLSPILKRYEAEFDKKYGGVSAFSGKYLISDPILLWRAKAGTLRVEYASK